MGRHLLLATLLNPRPSRRSDDSTVEKEVTDGNETSDAVVQNPVDHEDWRTGAALRVLDRTPSRRDDVAVHRVQARAGGLHVAPVTEVDTGCRNRHSGRKSRHD